MFWSAFGLAFFLNRGAKFVARKYTNQKKLVKYLKLFLVALSLIVLVAFGFYLKERHDEDVAIRQAELAKQKILQQKLDFINEVAPIAQKINKQYGIYASVTIAQAALESDFGRSVLAAKYHNLFGVKGSDLSNTKELETKEYLNGSWVTIKDRFRVYSSIEESITDHSLLFVNGTTWNNNQYEHVLAADSPASAAKALEQDGYATDPTYAQKLIELIKQYNLTKYD
ncbi:mannosyl-glycoprotein endo-beta-N-acetylglucosamidase [Amylolactobacillus amylotrophicus DSM 20534]|uniref:Mannosyl-glycoprotein endo-beta-N-acetylglucosamidase n=2 Tax=Amylolactobacillus TaxID=2767876 RepID=A0A0R1YRS1_9LACO|nr:mannosyl-glycoprotein endo-beta-N-acetylglucosamidase [Amylolactobacillus amylotrophicus DSM 20534]KRM41948.1 mannosyl-glycoprotein endo-beta-N-acetylglucosamidase [Amylolactobacillus amylophilus DSM 20533 = JCM 1125]